MVALDFTPDLIGVWWKKDKESDVLNTLEGDYGVFLMYLEKGKKWNLNGTSIDNLGLARISKYNRTPTSIDFIKEYSQLFPNEFPTLNGPIGYVGGGGINFYQGNWQRGKDRGLFHLGDAEEVVKSDNPVAKIFIRYETTKLMRRIEELQKESPFVPIIPEDHIRS